MFPSWDLSNSTHTVNPADPSGSLSRTRDQNAVAGSLVCFKNTSILLVSRLGFPLLSSYRPRIVVTYSERRQSRTRDFCALPLSHSILRNYDSLEDFGHDMPIWYLLHSPVYALKNFNDAVLKFSQLSRDYFLSLRPPWKFSRPFPFST